MSEPLVIPFILGGPKEDRLIELSGRDYLLSLAIHPRAEHCELMIKNSAGVILACGQKMPGNAPMFRLFDDPEMPPGVFWVVDMGSNTGRDPDRDTLGSEVLLMYHEVAISG